MNIDLGFRYDLGLSKIEIKEKKMDQNKVIEIIGSLFSVINGINRIDFVGWMHMVYKFNDELVDKSIDVLEEAKKYVDDTVEKMDTYEKCFEFDGTYKNDPITTAILWDIKARITRMINMKSKKHTLDEEIDQRKVLKIN
jgi:hypothetical protein